MANFARWQPWHVGQRTSPEHAQDRVSLMPQDVDERVRRLGFQTVEKARNILRQVLSGNRKQMEKQHGQREVEQLLRLQSSLLPQKQPPASNGSSATQKPPAATARKSPGQAPPPPPAKATATSPTPKTTVLSRNTLPAKLAAEIEGNGHERHERRNLSAAEKLQILARVEEARRGARGAVTALLRELGDLSASNITHWERDRAKLEEEATRKPVDAPSVHAKHGSNGDRPEKKVLRTLPLDFKHAAWTIYAYLGQYGERGARAHFLAQFNLFHAAIEGWGKEQNWTLPDEPFPNDDDRRKHYPLAFRQAVVDLLSHFEHFCVQGSKSDLFQCLRILPLTTPYRWVKELERQPKGEEKEEATPTGEEALSEMSREIEAIERLRVLSPAPALLEPHVAKLSEVIAHVSQMYRAANGKRKKTKSPSSPSPEGNAPSDALTAILAHIRSLEKNNAASPAPGLIGPWIAKLKAAIEDLLRLATLHPASDPPVTPKAEEPMPAELPPAKEPAAPKLASPQHASPLPAPSSNGSPPEPSKPHATPAQEEPRTLHRALVALLEDVYEALPEESPGQKATRISFTTPEHEREGQPVALPMMHIVKLRVVRKLHEYYATLPPPVFALAKKFDGFFRQEGMKVFIEVFENFDPGRNKYVDIDHLVANKLRARFEEIANEVVRSAKSASPEKKEPCSA